MSDRQMAQALAPLRASMARAIREQEVLRVAATLPALPERDVVDVARREVLRWSQRRSGGRLPKEGWEGENFEYLAGGRTTLGVRIRKNDADLWGLRGDDPDKSVARRTWTTEVTVGRQGDDDARLGLRLMVSTPEERLHIQPSVPGVVQQLVTECGIRSISGHELTFAARRIGSDDDVQDLVSLLEDPVRQLPVVVASGDERSAKPDEPLLDADALARAMVGLAHVFILPAPWTYALSDAFGKTRSVFYGAVRVFLPGFDSTANPHDHRLVLGAQLQEEHDARMRELRVMLAGESLRRARLGHDVLTFATLRTAALREEVEGRTNAGASEADQLEAERRRSRGLEDELERLNGQLDQYFDLAHDEEERAKAAEAQLFGARARVQQLEEQLAARGQSSDADLDLPTTWGDFAEWCDQALVGRVVLSPAARRNVKAPEFEDVAMAARCLLWLAGPCRDRRINGGGSLDDARVDDGLWNTRCGADAFTFEFHGHRLDAEWHIKNGGNTRDPKRCLRIYYGWDPATQQIVVADMPAHRRTGAS